ncbi:MAG: CotS family spore coat protein [Bacillota bacterium]
MTWAYAVTDREIQEVIAAYDINPILVKKIRSAYKIICTHHNYCLKKLRHGREKAIKGKTLVEHLKKKGFLHVADYIETKNRKLYVEKQGSSYYLTEWIDGREVSFRKKKDLTKAVMDLARFHQASMGFAEGPRDLIERRFEKTYREFYECLAELKKYKQVIEQKTEKYEWEHRYLMDIDFYIDKGEKAITLFKAFEYEKLIKKDGQTKGICHGSYYYQNIIVDQAGNHYIIDLDSCTRDLYMYDVGKFIRRMLWAKEFQWDFDIVRSCIDMYHSIVPIGKSEIGILLGIIIFPHKYWRLGNKRYDKIEAWSEKKYDRKLDKLTKFKPYIEKFLREYCKYYGIEMNEEGKLMV